MNRKLIQFYLRRELLFRPEYTLLLLLSISLGIGSVIGISSYREAIQSAIQKEAKQLMGADIALQSAQEFTTDAKEMIQNALPVNSEQSHSIQFLSMLLSKSTGESSLSYIKALEGNYPFYGEMLTEPKDVFQSLGQNEILLDETLGKNLKLKIGEQVQLGSLSLKIKAWIKKEPGAVGSFVGAAPTSIIRSSAAMSSGLIQRGSRIRYTTYLKFPLQVDSNQWKETHFESFIKNDITIYHNTEVNSGSQQFLKNTFDYMSLLALAGFFLGAISVYASIRTRIRERKNEISILMCLGAEPKVILILVLSEILVITSLATAFGILLGFQIQDWIPSITGSEFLLSLQPQISLQSFFKSIVLGILIPVLIAVPLLIEASGTKPLSALKEVDSREDTRSERRIQFLSIFGIYVLFVLIASIETSSFIKGSVFAVVLVSLPVLVFVLLKVIGFFLNQFTEKYLISKEWSLVFKKFTRKSSSLQLSLIGLGSALFILCLSFILQESLLELSGAREIERRPNIFLLDIRKEQKDGIQEIINRFPIQKQITAPVIGARLTKVNGEGIKKENMVRDARERTWRATARTREYFLSYRDALYDTEKVTKGSWWGSEAKDEISVEREFSGYLEADVGDSLTFNIQGVEVQGKISNLRSVNWSDMKPNFVVLFSRGTLERAPSFLITSLLLESGEDRYQLQKAIVSKYPNITVIDTEKTIQAFLGILEKVTQMIRLMTLLILMSAFVLVLTSLYSSQFERKKEFSLLRVIGSSNEFLLTYFLRESFLIASLSFFIGSAYSLLANEILNRIVLNLTSVIPWTDLLVTFVSVVVLSLLLYLTGIGRLFFIPSKRLLKEIK
ncbi:ABC transporter permease [Leptospira ryugenii]|uniref:ABC transporter permease n=1 Tax=Leptospira ryugenii TaxID=1917863 RepID=A0A2P2E2K1_9LEPT|nr:FtsX-like permease family protein [Leptospira ryugenii]GBF51101.1 ABC transporter permease [Leptospira ryugenii]